MKYWLLILICRLLFSYQAAARQTQNELLIDTAMVVQKKQNNDQNRNLTAEQYRVLIECGTEPPGSGKYYDFYEKGMYICIGCGQELFHSDTKFASGTGWPSFFDVISDNNISLAEDNSLGLSRTEVKCANCKGHLGHVFSDGPKPTKLRYCINSVVLEFIEE